MMNLATLQSQMKCDPEGNQAEVALVYGQFNSSVMLFEQQAAMKFTHFSGIERDASIAKELGDRATMLAHVAPLYPELLTAFPKQLLEFLRHSARSLPSSLRLGIVHAIILLTNRKILDIEGTLELFMDLQSLGDKDLRSRSFSHIIDNIRHMNRKHKNEVRNRSLQNALFKILQLQDEVKARRALVILCDLHRRKVWFDERTANAICTACFHESSRIMVCVLSFLLNYEIMKGDENDDDEDDAGDAVSSIQKEQVVLSKEIIYKAHHKGTVSSKKRKKKKLQRIVRSAKKQQRASAKVNVPGLYSPLNSLIDPQGFTEKLFSRLLNCNERFEVRMMMLKVIARSISLHRLVLLNFYPYMQKYAHPHQRDVTCILATAVQACHDMVPPDAVESLFRHIVNQFVHDRARPEAITVGLNVVREICLRMPLLMTEDLLQDLVLYKKTNQKSVSSAARSLMTLFREVCPSLLVKKDRGRAADLHTRRKAFGEVNVATNVPGIEFLGGMSGCGDDGGDGSDGDEMEADEDMSRDGDEDGAVLRMSESGTGDDVSSDGMDEDEVSEDGESSPAKRQKIGGKDVVVNSLGALRRLMKTRTEEVVELPEFLSNEDFQKLKELRAEEGARIVMLRGGMLGKGNERAMVPTSDRLTLMRVDPADLEAHVRMKMSKEERLAMVQAGREERGKYYSRTAVKQKKIGGLSNRQKERRKGMPIAAKRAKVARCREQKRRKMRSSAKQFRGRKAWK